MTNQEKAKKYVASIGSKAKALIEIRKFIKELEAQYPTGYDYHSTKNYQSVMKIKEEIDKVVLLRSFKCKGDGKSCDWSEEDNGKVFCASCGVWDDAT